MQFNLSCNIAAKGVVKRCCAFYYTLVQIKAVIDLD